MLVQNCWNCGRKAYETCSGCHRARYCGTFCQHRHWETHHLTCKSTTARSSPPAPVTAPRDGKSAADHGRSPRVVDSKASNVTVSVSDQPAIDFSASSTTVQRRSSSSPTTSETYRPITSSTATAAAAGELSGETASKATAVV